MTDGIPSVCLFFTQFSHLARSVSGITTLQLFCYQVLFPKAMEGLLRVPMLRVAGSMPFDCSLHSIEYSKAPPVVTTAAGLFHCNNKKRRKREQCLRPDGYVILVFGLDGYSFWRLCSPHHCLEWSCFFCNCAEALRILVGTGTVPTTTSLHDEYRRRRSKKKHWLLLPASEMLPIQNNKN